MFRYTALILLACACFAVAQTPEDPEVARAEAELTRARQLVSAGAIPRAQVAKAEEAVADAEDSAFLRKTLYGKDLTEGQADEMVAAAHRRFDRRKKTYDDALKLVELGAAGQLSAAPAREELEMARRASDLAQSRAELTREVARMAGAEEELQAKLAQSPSEASALAERFDGDGVFSSLLLSRVERAFELRFGKPMPVSAIGETAVHRALGFDHTGRVDVALHPDTAEGEWLLHYLTAQRIPFYAFRQAVPGKATGAHIHIGPGSTRLASGG